MMVMMAVALRSKNVDGVQQEIWSPMIAYNLVRLEIAKAALDAKSPTDISFIRAFHTIQYELRGGRNTLAREASRTIETSAPAVHCTPKRKRPRRTCDRVVKEKPKRYTIQILKKTLI